MPQCFPVVIEPGVDAACATRPGVNREARGQGERAGFQPLDAEEFIAKRAFSPDVGTTSEAFKQFQASDLLV
jgi:hypothetical protein